MYFMTCGAIVMLFLFFMLLFLSLASPLSLAFLFFNFVMLSTVSGYLFSSDFVPYMLYLIYVGGLLVLVVYMVIISTNYQLAYTLHKWLVALFMFSVFTMTLLYLRHWLSFSFLMKNMSSIGGMEINKSALIILVLFLLYTFMYVCESVRLGGRALKVSGVKY